MIDGDERTRTCMNAVVQGNGLRRQV
jgi:hypothetical protein